MAAHNYKDDTYYNKQIINCNSCQTKDVISQSDIQKGTYRCLCCDRIEKAKLGINFNPTIEMQRVMKLENKLSHHRLRSNSASILPNIKEYRGIKLGDTFGDLRVTGFVGTLIKNNITGAYSGSSEPTEVILKCIHCNYYSRVINVNRLIDGIIADKMFECSICHPVIIEQEKRIKDFKNKQKEHKNKIVLNRNEKLADKTIDELDKDNRIFRGKLNIEKIQAGKNNANVKKVMEGITDMYPEIEIDDIEKIGKTNKFICHCKKCGTQLSIPSQNIQDFECVGCKKLEETGTYIGIFKKDMIGVTINLLELIQKADSTNMCKVRCCLCNQIYNNIPFYNWYSGKIMCNCDGTELKNEIICSNCNNYVSIRFKDMINAKDRTADIKCDKCGASIGETPQDIIDDYIEIPSRSVTLSNRLKISRKKVKGETSFKGLDNNLIVCKTPSYVGTDGKYYYSCRCLLHNQDMTLSDDEISTFNHEQCDDKRQHITNELSKENIKMEN